MFTEVKPVRVTHLDVAQGTGEARNKPYENSTVQ
jgi:hypothetical protein